MPDKTRSSWTPQLDRRQAKPSNALILLAICGVFTIAFVTLCPIGLRPRVASPDSERFAAYLVLGAVLASALPRRFWSVSAFVVMLAFSLEAAQLLVPGRDAVFNDGAVKAVGGVFGVVGGYGVFRLRRFAARFLQLAPDGVVIEGLNP